MSKTFWIILGILIPAVILVVTLRLWSGEDNWICKDGQWIKHGNPSSSQPMGECK